MMKSKHGIRCQFLLPCLLTSLASCPVLSENSHTGEEQFDEHVSTAFLTNQPSFLDVPSNHHEVDLNELLEVCPDVNRRMSDDCLHELTEYFIDDPIWLSWRFSWYRGLSGAMSDDETMILNDRPVDLKYAFDDFLIADVPRWSDLFDKQVEQRNQLISNVFRDEACLRLNQDGGIVFELQWHCHARDAFKYAALIDACVTAPLP